MIVDIRYMLHAHAHAHVHAHAHAHVTCEGKRMVQNARSPRPATARQGTQSSDSPGKQAQRLSTHLFRSVVKDVAVFKVRLTILFDQEPATLQAEV